MMASEMKAGTTAIQNTVVKLSANIAMKMIAASGPSDRTDGVERLPQAEGGAAQIGRRKIGNECIARRATDALADPVDEAGRRQPGDAGGQRKHRLGESGESIAERRQQLALAQIIAERAGKDLGDRGRRFRNAFDEADGERRGAEHRHQIERQQGMDHLGGEIHEQRHQPERPDAAGNFAPTEQ